MKLEGTKISDPTEFIREGYSEIEIDGLSLDPPIIIEITSILRKIEKINEFIKKKEFIEQKYNQKFRGFFVAAGSNFDREETGEIAIKLRKKGCELINL